MKSILGFGIEEAPAAESVTVPAGEGPRPVRCLASVRFSSNGRALTYYNDAFALEPGDHVFVSGKLAGQLGVVEKVTTRFKISLSDYERVISKASANLHGTWEAVMDKMVSWDREAMAPEEFRSWILPPVRWEGDGKDDQEDDVVIGDGYELDFSALGEGDDVTPAVLERAAEYCRDGKVAYISVRGVGTAFVEGSSWYEVNFRLHGNAMTEMYCDCLYPGLCKHLLAVAMTVCAMAELGSIDPDADFTVIGKDRFWAMAACSTKKVTL